MKKSIFFFLFSFLLFPLAHAEEESKSVFWDLNESCFEESATVEHSTEGTVKIRMNPENPLFFLQGQKILPYRIFEYGDESDISYTVLETSGTSENASQTYPFLSDGNMTTEFAFDPYSSAQKEILIDTKKILPAGTFSFQLHKTGNVQVRYFISKNNTNFIEVHNIENYDVRYIKVRFENYSRDDETSKPIAIQELHIPQEAAHTFLVNTENTNPIIIYANYRCQKDDTFFKIKNKTERISHSTNFSVSAATQQFDVALTTNEKYDNDFDNDGLSNDEDNCPYDSNANQKDVDGDLVGDACDFDNETKNFFDQDDDDDGVGNSVDNCPYVYNPQQIDSNADKRGDLCADDDGDGIIGWKDNCISVSNRDQKDININGIGDACEFDRDADGVSDSIDNCRNMPNPNQEDEDNDGIGDACDNCYRYNPQQIDRNNNGIGDTCEEYEEYLRENDKDGDLVLDFEDNCPEVSNPEDEEGIQADEDKDGIGDACDNCPRLQNPDQADKNENGVGDMCEDVDEDGIEGYLDNCPYFPNADQADQDNDGVGDSCEDDDGDGILAGEDNCPFDANANQWDSDHDGIGDVCDDKDDRFMESNKWVVVAIIVLITTIFGVMIFQMIRKLRQ